MYTGQILVPSRPPFFRHNTAIWEFWMLFHCCISVIRLIPGPWYTWRRGFSLLPIPLSQYKALLGGDAIGPVRETCMYLPESRTCWYPCSSPLRWFQVEKMKQEGRLKSLLHVCCGLDPKWHHMCGSCWEPTTQIWYIWPMVGTLVTGSCNFLGELNYSQKFLFPHSGDKNVPAF